jgi:hypothetical protein
MSNKTEPSDTPPSCVSWASNRIERVGLWKGMDTQMIDPDREPFWTHAEVIKQVKAIKKKIEEIKRERLEAAQECLTDF